MVWTGLGGLDFNMAVSEEFNFVFASRKMYAGANFLGNALQW